MAKDNKTPASEEVEAENAAASVATEESNYEGTGVEVSSTDVVTLEDRAKSKKGKKADDKVEETAAAAPQKSAKKKVNPNKKSLGKKIKEVISELKKVSWPSFGKILKQTGIVIAVVLFFLVVIGLADTGLSALAGLVVGS